MNMSAADWEKVLEGEPQPFLPITTAVANWNGHLTAEAVGVVNQLRLDDLAGDRADGEGHFRGSKLGSCPRMQLLSYRGHRGVEAEETGREIMREGTYRHYFWQEVGLSIPFLSEVEHKASIPEAEYAGQLDGVMLPVPEYDGVGVFELKTSNSVSWKNAKENGQPIRKHLLQTVANMRAMGASWASVVYEKRDFKVEWFEYVVVRSDELDAMLDEEIIMLHSWRDAGKLPPVKVAYPQDNECKTWCSFTRTCPSAEY